MTKKNTFNKKHPELRDGEIFLTNTANPEMTNIGRKGKRLGDVAYDVNGEKVDGLFPVFCAPDPALDKLFT